MDFLEERLDGATPERWIHDLERPAWDQYFMGMVFLAAMRSHDQQTKQGCVIVDWDTRTVLGTGYNGHPRGTVEPQLAGTPREYIAAAEPLPTLRAGGIKPDGTLQRKPDKYACMVHADTNAVVNAAAGRSDNAVMYLPMPPCETCLGILANMPFVKIRRIVYLEDRDLPNTRWLLEYLPHIRLEKYTGPNPAEVLLNAAAYVQLRLTQSQALSAKSATTYTS
jgi:dCMP deaminase